MKILFITSSRIGDAVLSTGPLNHISQRCPEARVTIACAPLVVSLFTGYPQLERIITVKKEKHNKHWIALWKEVIGTRWDMVIDIRNSFVSRAIWARQRFIFGSHIDDDLHKAVQNALVMRLSHVPEPKLWFTPEQVRKAETLIPSQLSSRRKPGSGGQEQPDPVLQRDDNIGMVLGVGPTANWIGKTWPYDRFIEVIRFMTAQDGVMDGARVAIFAAPGEEEIARKVLASIPADRAIDVIAKTDPATAAAAIARCSFYIGNDSGLMHCAAAVGVPTLGLFGASWPHIYAPYGKHCAFVSTPENFDELTDFAGYDPKTLDHTLMSSLTVESVKDAIMNHPSLREGL